MRFRKKPVVIDAEQWEEGKDINGVCKGVHTRCALYLPHIHALEGTPLLTPGDWVITDIQGDKYLCKPHIFEQTYEPVGDEEV